MIAIGKERTSALGVIPSGDELTFKLYPGRFANDLLKWRELSLFSSSSSLEYVQAAITKRLKLVDSPVGPGPGNWTLATRCSSLTFSGEGPWKVSCKPTKAFARPCPPPSRAFFYILEAAIHSSRAFMGIEYVERALRLLEEAERLADEDDKLAIVELKEYLGRFRKERELR